MTCSRRLCLGLFLAATQLSGCFSFRHVEVESVPVGSDVRVHLTRVGMTQIPEEIASSSGTTLRGQLLEWDAGNLLIRVALGVHWDGAITRSLGQGFPIPRPEVLLVEKREFEALRTGLAVGGGVAAAAVLLHVFRRSRSEDHGGLPPPPGEETRIPLISIPVR
jgi:hypothetical protein